MPEGTGSGIGPLTSSIEKNPGKAPPGGVLFLMTDRSPKAKRGPVTLWGARWGKQGLVTGWPCRTVSAGLLHERGQGK